MYVYHVDVKQTVFIHHSIDMRSKWQSTMILNTTEWLLMYHLLNATAIIYLVIPFNSRVLYDHFYKWWQPPFYMNGLKSERYMFQKKKKK